MFIFYTIAVILFLLPFFLIAYSIFLLKESQTNRYSFIYRRALIYTLPSLVIMHLYFFAPPVNHRINEAYKLAKNGYFVGVDNKDTIHLHEGLIDVYYGDKPKDNFSSTFLMYPAANRDKWEILKEGLGSYFNGSKIEIRNQTLAILYPLYFPNDEIEKSKFNRSRKRNSFYEPPERDICIEYNVTITGEEMVLVPKQRSAKPAHFKRK